MKFTIEITAVGTRGINNLVDVGIALGQSMKGRNCGDDLKPGDQAWLRNEKGIIVGLWKVEEE